MISPNLGFADRLIRLALAALFMLLLLSQPMPLFLQVIVATIALCLCLNAIFGRCYLWCWLKLRPCKPHNHSVI